MCHVIDAIKRLVRRFLQAILPDAGTNDAKDVPMPVKPLRPCSYPGCSSLTPKGYCTVHERTERQRYELSRGTAARRGYDATWMRLRKLKLNNDPLCQRCTGRSISVAATLVHHKDRNPRNNTEENLESLCVGCHDREHKWNKWGQERSGGGR